MNDIQSLSHTAWVCHLVWIPKYRKKEIYGAIRKYTGEALRELALHKDSKIIEGHFIKDHVHILISISLNYSVPQVVGYMKRKSAIHIARN